MTKDDECMAIFAMRYCVGRRTYACQLCADWIKLNWDKFPNQEQVLKQLNSEIEWHEKLGSLGDECDKQTWHGLRAWMEDKLN